MQDLDSISLHPLHISRTLSQIYPRGVLEIRKIGRNKIVAEMCTYKAANRLVENKSLIDRNLKAFIPLHRILRTGVIRDVPQDFTTEMLRESIASPIKVLDIHRLNRKVRIENEIKYLPSRTVCVKFSGQSLPEYIYLYDCRYAVSPYVPKARICFSCFRVGHVSKLCKSRPRCLLCGEVKHTFPELCSRAQGPQVCINCSGSHLATSHLCPHVVKHKMTLSLASTQNIPYSEAKKSVNFLGYNTNSLQISDPRYDYVNYPNTLSLSAKSSPLSFETSNKFLPLFNLGNSSTNSNSSPSASFSSIAKRRPSLINSNLSGDISSRKQSPRGPPLLRPLDTKTSHSRYSQPSSSAILPNFQAHYDLLAFLRPPSQTGNGIALAPRLPPLVVDSPTNLISSAQ